MKTMMTLVAGAAIALSAAARAQEPAQAAAAAAHTAQGHGHHHTGPATPAAPPSPATPAAQGAPHAGHEMGKAVTPQVGAHAAHSSHGQQPQHDAPMMDHAAHGAAAMNHGADHQMPAMLGPYGMSREASGTAWQPDSSPVLATMFHAGDWMGMAQGNATLVHSDQGGPRGDRHNFVESMAMVMANRPIGEHGRLGLRGMLSLDPLMGRRGYPLLFAVGETADGVNKLVDRQHPHDLFMELAVSYSHDLGDGRAAFLYAGLPGEPALGPPTFMHRLSGLDNPEAPLGHHWFDSTHITWGVITAGFSTRTWKIEASAFKGREPDEKRWDIETPRLDSWSVRAFWNPTANLSLQASTGFLKSPEQLHPDENEQRTTASTTWNKPLGPGANWATTVAWSRKDLQPGPVLNAWLAESLIRWDDKHTVYARAERNDQGELFGEDNPLHHDIFTVNKLSLGYQVEVPVTRDVRLAFGGLASAYAYPDALKPFYGDDGLKSFMVYTRLNFGNRSLR